MSLINSIRLKFASLVLFNAKNKDRTRRGYILNILLSGIFILITFALGINLFRLLIYRNSYNGDSPLITLIDRVGSAIIFLVILGITTVISLLSNSEIQRALKRARRSELALKKQKDKLEDMVINRTKQLEFAQAEKLSQLYRFAEFGKLASGLFHDLVNPLTLTSLNLNSLNKNIRQPELTEARTSLKNAIVGIRRLEDFVRAARKQMQDQVILKKFSLKAEINSAIEILNYKAKKNQIKISFRLKDDIQILNNPIRFNQLVTNLLANAIDAYDHSIKKQKSIEIRLSHNTDRIFLEFQDWGSGIKKDYLPKIFDPLFTTKGTDKGTGIGLYICKEIIEKDLKGEYSIKSEEDEGTIIEIKFPKNL